MHVVVVGQPAWKLLDDGLGVRPRAHTNIVPFERPDERLGHAVGLRAADPASCAAPGRCRGRNAENVTFIESSEVPSWYLANWTARQAEARRLESPGE